MVKTIKVLKCPQCGSKKHTQTDDKHYRCNSCGAEFYIDDDDININVNHRFDNGSSLNIGHGMIKNTKLITTALIFPLALFLFFGGLVFFKSSHKSSFFDSDSIEVHDNYGIIQPINCEGKVIFAYTMNRRYSMDYYNDKPKHTNGVYYGFRDAQTSKVLVERLLISEKDEMELHTFWHDHDDLRYFHQANRWFLITSCRFIYEIDPKAMTIKNVSKTLFGKRPAMNSGISDVRYVERYDGEGFKVINNIGETYYYFPATDRLYTETAYNHARRTPPNELNNEVRDSIYYRLESMSGSSGKRIRIEKVQFKFHLGDPQDAPYLDGSSREGDQRLIRKIYITEPFMAFSASILYQDAHYLLLTYCANLSPEAPTVVQLRSTNGQILWTQSLGRKLEMGVAARDNRKIWLTGINVKDKYESDTYCFCIDIASGKWSHHYSFPRHYKIK